MIEVRLSRRLCNEIRANIIRPHPIAFERVGFVYGKLDDPGSTNPLVLLYRYSPVPDEQYLDDQKLQHEHLRRRNP